MGGYCSVLLGFLSFQSILFLSFFIVLYCGPILLLCWVSACGLQIEALFDKQCLHQYRPQQAAQVPKARDDAQQSRQRRLMLPSFVVARRCCTVAASSWGWQVDVFLDKQTVHWLAKK